MDRKQKNELSQSIFELTCLLIARVLHDISGHIYVGKHQKQVGIKRLSSCDSLVVYRVGHGVIKLLFIASETKKTQNTG